MAKVLVIGGAGYVGGTCCAWLKDQGHEVWILDDLSTGHRSFTQKVADGFVEARAGDSKAVRALAKEKRFDCAMHFAAKCLVAESVEKPDLYFENNVLQTESLIHSLLDEGVKRFIFSSTCAVFGQPSSALISENLPKAPLNPYGATKLEAERRIQKAAQERGLQAIALRYFNACGTEPQMRVGEIHEPETHLIPNVLRAGNSNAAVSVFGTDYPTADGTCVRDYIHVWDLAAAHALAMQRLLASGSGGNFEDFNLGTGRGYSVREVIMACEITLGRKIPVRECPRRPGDPAQLVAQPNKAREVLGFIPKHSDLSTIVASAAKWAELYSSKLPPHAVDIPPIGPVRKRLW